MSNNRKKGNAAEDSAARWIEKNKGYKIIERNYKRRGGEIDIIALDGEVCAFIEVKYRKDTECGYPSEAVTVGKQERIIRTAMKYTTEKGVKNPRFDIAEIIEKDGKKYIRYTENAFEWRTVDDIK